jgi:hypothetical protein
VISCGLVGGYQDSSETLVTIYKTMQHHNPEDQHQNTHCRENFILQTFIVCLLWSIGFKGCYVENFCKTQIVCPSSLSSLCVWRAYVRLYMFFIPYACGKLQDLHVFTPLPTVLTGWDIVVNINIPKAHYRLVHS